MERQALRRVDDGLLTDDQIENIGSTLMALEARMSELREHFGLASEDLNLDLGPLGPLSLQQLGMRACPVCGSTESLGMGRCPVVLIDADFPPACRTPGHTPAGGRSCCSQRAARSRGGPSSALFPIRRR